MNNTTGSSMVQNWLDLIQGTSATILGYQASSAAINAQQVTQTPQVPVVARPAGSFLGMSGTTLAIVAVVLIGGVALLHSRK